MNNEYPIRTEQGSWRSRSSQDLAEDLDLCSCFRHCIADVLSEWGQKSSEHHSVSENQGDLLQQVAFPLGREPKSTRSLGWSTALIHTIVVDICDSINLCWGGSSLGFWGSNSGCWPQGVKGRSHRSKKPECRNGIKSVPEWEKHTEGDSFLLSKCQEQLAYVQRTLNTKLAPENFLLRLRLRHRRVENVWRYWMTLSQHASSRLCDLKIFVTSNTTWACYSPMKGIGSRDLCVSSGRIGRSHWERVYEPRWPLFSSMFDGDRRVSSFHGFMDRIVVAKMRDWATGVFSCGMSKRSVAFDVPGSFVVEIGMLTNQFLHPFHLPSTTRASTAHTRIKAYFLVFVFE